MFKLIAFLAIIGTSLVLSSSKKGHLLIFWMIIYLLFVRKLDIPYFGNVDFSAALLAILFLLNPSRFFKTKLIRYFFKSYLFALVISVIIGLINGLPIERIWRWVHPFLTVYALTGFIIYFIDSPKKLYRLQSAFLFIAFIFSITSLMGYLGIYDGVIIFGGKTAREGALTISSNVYGISYTNNVMSIAAIAFVFIPYQRWTLFYKLLFCGVVIGGIMITLKRMAILSLVISLIYFLYVRFSDKPTKTLPELFLALIIVLIGTSFINIGIVNKIIERFSYSIDALNFSPEYRFIETSTQIRIDRLNRAFDFFKKSPLFGQGAGFIGYVHNGFLEILASIGIIGLFLFSPVYKVFKLGFRRILRNPWAIALAIYFLTIIMFEAGINRNDLIYYWGLFLGGAIVFEIIHPVNQQHESKPTLGNHSHL